MIPQADIDRLRADWSGKAMVDLVEQGKFGSTAVALTKKRKGEWQGLCPFHADRKPSFSVVIDKPGKPAFYHCFACGAHGSAIDYVMNSAGVEFLDAVRRMLGIVESPRSAPARAETPEERAAREAEAEASAAQKFAAAQLLWRGAKPGQGSIVQRYLEIARGIPLAAIGGVPPTLRWGTATLGSAALEILGWRSHPGLGRYDMMVAAFLAPGDAGSRGRFTGVHVTFLPADGVGVAGPGGGGRVGIAKRKIMLGGSWGSAIRLAPAAAQMCGGEGIETTLSGMALNPGWAGWASGSLGNLAGAGAGAMTPHPTAWRKWVPSPDPDMDRPGMRLPAECEEFAFLGDSDSDRLITGALIRRAVARCIREGRRGRAVWAPDGQDWNDPLMAAARQNGRAAA